MLLALAAASPATARDGPPTPAALYLRTCSACHGEKGDGKSLAAAALKTAPRDFTTEEARTALTREYMIAIVRDGRPHTAMVGRTARLSQAEIEGVVDFIRAAFVPPDPDSELGRGRALYRRSCAACHGDRGQGSRARGGRGPAPPLSVARAPRLTTESIVEAIGRHREVAAHAPGQSAPGPAGARAIAAYVRGAFIEAIATGREAKAD